MLPTLVEISTDTKKRNLLHYVVSKGRLNIVKTLLKSGVERAVPDVTKMTPLHYAAKLGRLEIVKVLLNNLINGRKEIDSLTLYNKTPVFLAAEFGYFEVVEFLVNKGANIHLATVNGETPYSIAQKLTHKSGYLNIVNFLKGRMNKEQQLLQIYA